MSNKVCEICGEEKPLIRYSAMMVCAGCVQKEINAYRELEETADERVASMNARHNEVRQADILAKQIQVDTSIEIDTDLFNAQTVSIKDMKEAIGADESIENKTLELFTRLKARHDLFQERIFQRNRANAVEGSAQRSIQQYFNEFSNQLRETEREALRIHDMTYKPKAPAKPKKDKLPPKKKYDRDALAKVAEETGMMVSTIQGLCVSFNLEPHQVPAKLEEMKQ